MEYGLTSTVNDKGNKALGGGMMTRESPEQQRFTNYFDVKSIREYSAKVEKLGGKVITPESPISDMGYFPVCVDGIFEEDRAAK